MGWHITSQFYLSSLQILVEIISGICITSQSTWPGYTHFIGQLANVPSNLGQLDLFPILASLIFPRHIISLCMWQLLLPLDALTSPEYNYFTFALISFSRGGGTVSERLCLLNCFSLMKDNEQPVSISILQPIPFIPSLHVKYFRQTKICSVYLEINCAWIYFVLFLHSSWLFRWLSLNRFQ